MSLRSLSRSLLSGVGLMAVGLSLAAPQAHAQISVRSALSNDHTVVAGTTYEGTIIVSNETDTGQQAKIYLTDYLFHADGTNAYGEPGSTARSNATWIQFNPSVLTLPPGETHLIQYTVSVPDSVNGDALSGSYWSLLMVESVPPTAPESTLPEATETPQYGVRPVMRYGIQLATHVQNTGTTEIGFAGGELVQAENGAHRLRVDVANTGSRMVRPQVWAELFDANGASQGRREGTINRIYPGTSVRQQIDLGALPSGTYKALVVVDSGDDEVYGAEYVLTL